MSYKPSDSYYGQFTTSRFDTGAATSADSLPVATATKNGTDDGAFALTVTLMDTGRYKITGTIPSGYAAGDVVQISVAATVNSVAGKAVVDSFLIDKYRLADVFDASGRVDVGKILGTASAGAAGYVGLDWGHITAPTTTVALTGTTIASSQVVASVTGAVGSVTGAVGSVTGAVGSVTGNVGGNVTGSVGSISGVTFPSNFADLAITASTGRVDLGKILGTVSAGAVGYVGIDWGQVANKTTTNDLTNTTIAASQTPPTVVQIRQEMDSNSTKLAHLDADISSRMATFSLPLNFDVLGIDVNGNIDVVTTVAGNVGGDLMGDVQGDVHGNVDGDVVGFVASEYVQYLLNPQAAGASTITLHSSALATDDFYNSYLIWIWDATGAGQVRTITDYVGSTRVATVDHAWTTNPDVTSRYLIPGLFLASSSGGGSDPWATLLPGAYGDGTAGKIVGTNLDATITSRPTASAIDTQLISTHGSGLWNTVAPTVSEIDTQLSGTHGAGAWGGAAASDPWLTTLPGAYASGTAGKILGTLDNFDVNGFLRIDIEDALEQAIVPVTQITAQIIDNYLSANHGSGQWGANVTAPTVTEIKNEIMNTVIGGGSFFKAIRAIAAVCAGKLIRDLNNDQTTSTTTIKDFMDEDTTRINSTETLGLRDPTVLD